MKQPEVGEADPYRLRRMAHARGGGGPGGPPPAWRAAANARGMRRRRIAPEPVEALGARC